MVMMPNIMSVALYATNQFGHNYPKNKINTQWRVALKNKNYYICISEEFDGLQSDTFFETLPIKKTEEFSLSSFLFMI